MLNKWPIEELLFEEEGTTLDFKRSAYRFSREDALQKCEILKDIIAFANAWRRTDAYILVGVQEVKGGRSRVLGIQDELDDAQLQQFVNSKTQRPITFEYRNLQIDGVKIGVIRIPIQTRPFYLKEDYGKLKRNVVYIRRGSSTDEATPDEIKDMGRAEVQDYIEEPALSFEFADVASRSSLGKHVCVDVKLLAIPPMDEIPDYTETVRFGSTPIIFTGENRDYYRDLVEYYYIENKSAELAFLLENDSSKVITDIRVELIFRKIDDKYTMFEIGDFPDRPSKHRLGNFPGIGEHIANSLKRTVKLQELVGHYRVEIPFEKAQPKQTVFSTETIYIAANSSFDIEVDVTIFADNISIPIKQRLELSCTVANEIGSLEHLIKLHDEYLAKLIEED